MFLQLEMLYKIGHSRVPLKNIITLQKAALLDNVITKFFTRSKINFQVNIVLMMSNLIQIVIGVRLLMGQRADFKIKNSIWTQMVHESWIRWCLVLTVVAHYGRFCPFLAIYVITKPSIWSMVKFSENFFDEVKFRFIYNWILSVKIKLDGQNQIQIEFI